MTVDADLVKAAVGGDRGAFASLLARHRPRATALARRLLGDAVEADDLFQEAALQAFLALDRLRDPGRFGSWLYGIVLNLGKMRLRQRGSELSLDGPGGRRLPESIDGALGGTSPEVALESLELLRRVREAIAVLPPGQRDVVYLHYLEGLSTEEIADLLGRSPGAVRTGLHRARKQLRRQLQAVAPTDEQPRKEPQTMVEVTPEDVIVRVIQEEGEEPRLVNEKVDIVLLREREGDRVLPIWVGSPEGAALALQLASESTPRPMTPDLMARLVEASGARVERVVVSRLEEKTFYAVIALDGPQGAAEVDARPSDALNLAVRVGAPVYVEDSVMDEAGVRGDDVFGALDRESDKAGKPPLEGEWRSLSPELVWASFPSKPK